MKAFVRSCWFMLFLLLCLLTTFLSAANDNDVGLTCPKRPKNWKKVLGKSRCKKKCRSNDDCRHSEKRCICDSTCGWSCVHRNARCQGLVDLPNGYVQSPADYTVGSTATFGCYEGFTLLGSAERKCQGNKKWSGIQPQCQPNVKCGPPPEVLNAYHSGSENQKDFELETLVHYTCVNGYYRPTSGLPKAKCLIYNGTAKWFGPDVQCIARSCGNPGTLINGKQEGFDFQYTYTVKYTCIDGYELIGSSVRKCQADGSWSGREPHCRPVQCPKPADPLHGKALGTSLDYLARITYSCDEGYRLVGQIPRVCQADRTWSGQEPICEEIKCPSLGPLENGYIQGVDTHYDAIVMFYCVDGAHLSGSQFAKCQKDGRWSSTPPKCLAACSLPKVENGMVRKALGSEKILHDHQIEIQCNEKHELATPEYPKCNNGRWSHVPKCVPVRCKDWPRNIKNGYVMFVNTDHESKAKYICKSGYRLVKSNETVQCRYGHWDIGEPACEEIVCEHPNDVGIRLSNGKIKLEGSMGTYEYKSYIKGIGEFRNIIFECDKGYVLFGPKRATCVNGTWEPYRIMHECRLQNHTPLEDTHWAIDPFVERKQRIHGRFKRRASERHMMVNIRKTLRPSAKDERAGNGNKQRPKQKSNNGLKGSKHRNANTVKVKEEKINVPVDRSSQNRIGNSKTTKNTNIVLFTCPPLIDDDKRRFANIRLNPDIGGRYPDSSQIIVQCQPGYELSNVENALIVCINGTWLPRPPLCEAKSCVLPQIPNAFFASQGEILNLGETILHSNGAKMYCMRGFQLSGNDVLECNLGKWLKDGGTCAAKQCFVPYLRYGHYLMDVLPTKINHQTVLKFECENDFYPNPVNEEMPQMGEVYCNLGDILPHNPECNADEGDRVLPPESTFGCRRPLDIGKAWVYREITTMNGELSAHLIDPYLAMYPNSTIVHYKCEQGVSSYPSDGYTVHNEASSVKCVNGDWFALLTPCADPDVLPYGVSSNNTYITEMQINGHKVICNKPNFTEDTVIIEGQQKDIYMHGAKLSVQCKNEAAQKWIIKCKRGTWKNAKDVHCSNVTSQRIITRSCIYNPIHFRHVYTFYEDRGEPLTFKEELPEGAQLAFRCNHVGLFQFMGSKKMICENSNWKGSLPHCRPLRIPWKEGQAPAILYRAKEGDFSLSISGEIVARKSSTLEIDCIFPRNKAQPRWDHTNTYRKYPQKWANATLHSRDADSSDTFNESMEVEVYRLTIYMARPEDSGVFFCVAPTGKRHSVKIRIIDIECPPVILKDPFIKYEATKENFFGSMIHFLCPTGYTLHGNVRIYCLEMGQWSNSVPTCNAVLCPSLSSGLHHALFVNISSREYQGVAAFRCAAGYILQGPPIVQCTEGGKWREPFPTCRAVSCSPPDIPQGAKMHPEKTNYMYGEVVTFSCDSGYMLSGKDFAVCTDGGQWSNSAPDCQRFCRYPGKPVHGETTSEPRDYYFVRDRLVYYCKSNQYKIVGKTVLECLPSGSWSNELPECRKRMRRHRAKSQQQ